MRPATPVAAQGLAAGIVGFLTVSIAFLVFDVVTGRGAGFTPTLLGTALFKGVGDACEVNPALGPILSYSAVHAAVFIGLGWLAAWLLAITEARPWFWIAGLFMFIFVLFHLYGALIGLLAPVRGCFSLYHVFGATALAAVAMFWYLLRRHRGLFATLARPENQ